MASLSSEFVSVAFENAIEIWGETGHICISKEGLIQNDESPSEIASEIRIAIDRRCKDLGRKFNFAVEEYFHPDLGGSFLIEWKEVK